MKDPAHHRGHTQKKVIREARQEAEAEEERREKEHRQEEEAKLEARETAPEVEEEEGIEIEEINFWRRPPQRDSH